MKNAYDILNDVKMDFSIYDEPITANSKGDTKTTEVKVLPKASIDIPKR